MNLHVKILPNPFGGVNTHLWSNEAYIVGIVLFFRPAYSLQKKKWERNKGEGVCLLSHCFETEEGVHSTTENSELSRG